MRGLSYARKAVAVGFTSDLTVGLAELLDAQGLGKYNPDGVFGPADTGITIAVVPDAPDRLICLTPYTVEDTGQTDVIDAVQIRMRTGRDPTALSDLADQVRDLLHGREGFYLRSVRISLAWRNSQGLMGQDVHGRLELAANYYLRSNRPAPYVHE